MLRVTYELDEPATVGLEKAMDEILFCACGKK